jgi:hypothetical protein
MPSILIITPNFKLSKASRTTKVVNDWVFGLASQGHDVFLHHVRVKYLYFDFFFQFVKALPLLHSKFHSYPRNPIKIITFLKFQFHK